MLRIYSVLMVALMSCMFTSVRADTVTTEVTTSPDGSTTTTERRVITTDFPAPKVVIEAPVNFVNCFRVESGWYNNVWAQAHKVCQYSNAPEGTAWVEGYWICSKYKSDTGECTSWDWKDAHWVKMLDVY